MASISRNKSTLPLNNILKIVLPLFTVLLIWEILYLCAGNSYVVPSISNVFLRIIAMLGEGSFYKATFTAFARVLAGLITGILSAVILAVACHYSSICTSIIAPLLSIMKATPIACIIVLLWINMNYTQLTIFVVVLMVIPIVWQNVYDGLSNIDQELIEVSEIFEFNFQKKFRFIILPTLVNYLIPSVITSIGLAWKSGIAAEIMTNSNIGRLIYNYKNITFDTESIFAWTIMIVSFSIVLEKSTAYVIGRLRNES